MISLTTQTEARDIRNLPFCYICGEPFKEEDLINYDHVPPAALFDKGDRNFPLKFAMHEDPCHSMMNLDDEVFGQLVALIHGKQPSERNDKLKIELYERQDTGAPIASFGQRNIEVLLRRWIKAFHAALYHEPLGGNAKYAIQAPFPSGIIENGKLVVSPIKEQYNIFQECISKNRLAKNLDYIRSNNGKLLYECVWDKFSDNNWACIFYLDLYGWKNLGDVNNFQVHECVGTYTPTNGVVPDGACVSK